MASQWTDKSAIMRDLSFAQGRWVPGSIDTAVTSGTPPAHNLNEETEEEYYKRWTGDGDFNACPDFSLISKMLEMVHEDVPDTQDIQTGTGPVEIRKLDPVAFVPKLRKTIKEIQENVETKQVKPKPDKKKKPLRERNVAIASIIANSLKPSQDVKEAPIKLSRPEDFIKTSSSASNIQELHALRKKNDSVHKVNSWLQSQDMSCMFKKKSESPKSPSPGQSDASARSLRNPGQQYVPSSWAGEYYKKCMERTHIRDMVQENVWVRAEKIMKEIDIRKEEEQRKQEEEDAALAAAMAAAEQETPPSEAKNDDDDTDKHDEPVVDSQGLASVLLPQHRHLLTGDCIVCKVLSKKPSETPFETKEVENVKPEFQDAIDGTDKNHDEDYFCLARSSFVEDLTNIEAAGNKLEESGSTEILDVSTSES